MIAYLHVQHHHRLGEPGAVADLDHDGEIELGEREREIVRGYLDACRRALLAGGCQVEVYDPPVSTYGGIHSLVRSAALGAGPAVYVAGHCNAGGGDYGLVGFDARSSRGREIAYTVATALRRQFPELRRVRPEPLTPGCPVSPRGFDCINGVWTGPTNLSGILLEPGFLDCPAHAGLWTPEGQRRIGLVLADGLIAYLSSEERT